MEFNKPNAYSVRREQYEPYELARNIVDEAFEENQVNEYTAHEWFVHYIEHELALEVYSSNELLRCAIFDNMTIDELLEDGANELWYETTLMRRPIGSPDSQLAKINLGIVTNDVWLEDFHRLKSHQPYIVDENAYRKELIACLRGAAFTVDYKFHSIHDSYQQLPLINGVAQYIDTESGNSVCSSLVDDNVFDEARLMHQHVHLRNKERYLQTNEMNEVREGITLAMADALHAGIVADALLSGKRHVAPRRIEVVEHDNRGQLFLKDTV